jgi:hypothetical protein
MKRLRYIVLLVMVMLAGLVVVAQESITPIGEPEDPTLFISFPPPVYVVSGNVEVQGTVNVPNMANYFLEFRPLELGEDAAETDATRPWFPASLPTTNPVSDGVIAAWNTGTAPDGLYELRLTVNVDRSETRYFRVSPLRIDNSLVPTPTSAVVQPTRPPLAPSPTGLPGQVNPRPTAVATLPPSSGPVVIASQNGNVRSGDSTFYPRIGVLFRDTPAPILGISSTGSGWYYIQLPNGSKGFIAPSVVRTEGNLVGLEAIVPPPPPPTWTPSPTFTNTPIPPTFTPVTPANLAIVSVQLTPAQPVCGSSFEVRVTVINNGTGATPSGFAVSAIDRHNASGTTNASTVGTVPPLNPGQSFVSIMYLTVSTFFDEAHSVNISVDSGGQIAETNEGDNGTSAGYTLAKGGC